MSESSSEATSIPVPSGLNGRDRDEWLMRLTLAQAERGRHGASPNPMVGGVIVKGDEVIATGFHARVGGDHGEVAALKAAGERARGSEIFINLEPCSHHGRTPPCSDALIAAGVRRVVAGMIDPNPQVSGRGIARLRDAGIEVDVGVCEAECRRLNEGFIVHMTEGRPFVTLKLAMSLDGRIATRTGDSRWITGEATRARVHEMRAAADGVLVGGNTLRLDNPRLTARDGADDSVRPNTPHRFALDTGLQISDDAAILDTDVAATTLFCAEDAGVERALSLAARSVNIARVGNTQGRLNLDEVLSQIGERSVLNLLVEGGGELAGELLQRRLVDRLVLMVAPIIIGGRDAIPVIGGEGADLVKNALRAQRVQVDHLKASGGESGDIIITADLREV